MICDLMGDGKVKVTNFYEKDNDENELELKEFSA